MHPRTRRNTDAVPTNLPEREPPITPITRGEVIGCVTFAVFVVFVLGFWLTVVYVIWNR
jgi:hypothetical protein